MTSFNALKQIIQKPIFLIKIISYQYNGKTNTLRRFSYDWLAVVHVEHDTVELGLGEPDLNKTSVMSTVPKSYDVSLKRNFIFSCQTD